MRPNNDHESIDASIEGVKISHATVQVGQQQIHVAMAGDSTNPALVLIHGSPGSWTDFKALLMDSLLLNRFYILSVDRPGLGTSGYGQPMPSLHQQSATIYQAIKQLLPHKSVTLAGHSYGGPVALQIAMDHPDAITELQLWAAAIDPGLEVKEWYRPIMANVGWLLPGAIKSSNAELMALKQGLEAHQHQWAQVRCPVAMVHGTDDILVPYANVAFAQSKLPANQLKVVTLKGANHFLPWTHRASLIQALMGTVQ